MCASTRLVNQFVSQTKFLLLHLLVLEHTLRSIFPVKPEWLSQAFSQSLVCPFEAPRRILRSIGSFDKRLSVFTAIGRNVRLTWQLLVVSASSDRKLMVGELGK